MANEPMTIQEAIDVFERVNGISTASGCYVEAWQVLKSAALAQQKNNIKNAPCSNCGSTKEPIPEKEFCPDCYNDR